MEPANPYRSSELPVEQVGDPHQLPTSSYASAGCSAMFVFVGGTLVAMFVLGMFAPPLWLALTVAPLVALVLAFVSGWETLRLERRKRRKRYEAYEAARNEPPAI